MMRKFRLFFTPLLIFAMNFGMAFADTEDKISLPFGGQLRQFNFYGLDSTDAENVWCVGAFGAIAHSGDGGKVCVLELNAVSAALLDAIEQNSENRSGEELLRALATTINYPDVEALVTHGADALHRMRQLGILTGTRGLA